MTDTPAIFFVSLTLSTIMIVFASMHTANHIRRLTKERSLDSAMDMLTAVGLLVIAVGLSVASISLILEERGWSATGVSMSRGALLVLITTLVIVEYRRK